MFLSFIVQIAPGSGKAPTLMGKPKGEASGEFETRPIPGLLPVSTRSSDETKAVVSSNEQGSTDPSGRSNSSTPGFQQGSTLNDLDSSPKTFLGNSHNPKTDISNKTGGEAAATQSSLPLTDCLLPLGNLAGQQVEVDAQPIPPERDSGVSMSGGRSRTGQPTSVTPSGVPPSLIRDTPTAQHSLPHQPSQSAPTLRSAPSARNGPIPRLNDNLSASKHSTAAGLSAHTGTLHAQRPYPPSHPLGQSRVSVQPSSRQPMTATSQNRSRSGHPGQIASTRQSGGGIFCCKVNKQ